MYSVIWMVLVVLLLVIEMFTLGLTTIWFACGSFVAFISTFLGADLWVQLILFIIVSVVLLMFTRPIAVKYFNKDRQKTNCDSLIGSHIKITEQVNNVALTGSAELDGKIWTVRSADELKTYEVGEIVTVKAIEGVKLIVEK